MPMPNLYSSSSNALIIAILCLGLTGFSIADSDSETARRLQQSGTIMDLETILQKVQHIQSGRVLEVELETEHQDYVYEVEILDDAGVVHKLILDAHSGDLLKSKKDD